METKKQIRKRILDIRDRLTEEELMEKSRAITKKVTEHSWFAEANVVFLYIDFRSEVRTRELIEFAWRAGKQTVIPKVQGEKMDFFLFQSWDELKRSSYGILEPCEECCPYFLPDQEDRILVIMPGVAFDRECSRIGYGGGYYDRYFADYPELHKLAIAFDLQITEGIQCESFDLKPDCVITEKNVFSWHK